MTLLKIYIVECGRAIKHGQQNQYMWQ